MPHEQLVANPPVAESILPRPPSRPATEDALRVLGLEKAYLHGFWRRRTTVVRGVSFTVPRGQVVALLGPNGAGKTTTIGCVLGLAWPDAGEITIFGEPHARPVARRRLGFLPEQPYFYEHLTGRELLHFYGRLLDLPAAERRRQVEELLARVGLADRADRPVRKCSKGMLQRLGLAQALLGRPDLLVLDEPMSGLDPIGRREARELLCAERDRGATILLSSHIVPDVEALADEALFLKNGLLVGRHRLDRREGRGYLVRVARLPGGPAAEPVLTACRPAPGAARVEATCAAAELAAPDAPSLARLLDLCSAQEIDVLDVRARRSDLEALFLAAMHDEEGEV
ncbi:MAG: ABC transporter ATP-binding protein [Candidatus Krumholzibacteriia bacterium]